MAQTEAQILEEISRLSGAIDRHKSQAQHAPRGGYRGGRPRAPASYRKPYAYPTSASGSSHTNAPQEVVLGGQVFQSGRGGKSLVRKGASRPPSRTPLKTSPASSPSNTTTPLATPPTQPQQLVHAGKNKLVAANRIGKNKPPPPPPAVLAAKRARLAKLSATLTSVQSHRNQRGAFGKRKASVKRKVVDKPCRFWTRTGICQNGNTCPYKHDPNKTAICPRFVTNDCPNTALTCPLSHDPTPERMPLCVHFQNAGRCRLGSACPYPHVFLGPDNVKQGVCRDFAVLGYCEKGVECAKNHVRECPDFAENGVCRTKGCKLPHVIRASKGKMAAAAAEADLARAKAEEVETHGEEPKVAAGQKLGDEFVSLMFEESEDEDEEEEEDDEEEMEGEREEAVTADEAEEETAAQGEDDEQDVDLLLSEDTEMV
ncbi:suppressor of glycerol defect protein 1 [Ceratobasidium sp. AG-Ba]|nr:suppressor of glycerol defect protein 1 [Ceratobasidium sp. AG-Ba]QRW02778.1 suppressor of glycerol defect protein 1 [Ceratobasidium sp. AG-Ba]